MPQQFLQKEILVKVDQKVSNFWATFVSNFVTKNFQKSPNLITMNWRSEGFNIFIEFKLFRISFSLLCDDGGLLRLGRQIDVPDERNQIGNQNSEVNWDQA